MHHERDTIGHTLSGTAKELIIKRGGRERRMRLTRREERARG
jgi:hypothetical protein